MTNMAYLFSKYPTFSTDISTWNVAKVNRINNMFNANVAPYASSFNKPIGAWNVGAVTDTSFMFDHARTFNRDVGAWNVGAVTNADEMFYGFNFSFAVCSPAWLALNAWQANTVALSSIHYLLFHGCKRSVCSLSDPFGTYIETPGN